MQNDNDFIGELNEKNFSSDRNENKEENVA